LAAWVLAVFAALVGRNDIHHIAFDFGMAICQLRVGIMIDVDLARQGRSSGTNNAWPL